MYKKKTGTWTRSYPASSAVFLGCCIFQPLSNPRKAVRFSANVTVFGRYFGNRLGIIQVRDGEIGETLSEQTERCLFLFITAGVRPGLFIYRFFDRTCLGRHTRLSNILLLLYLFWRILTRLWRPLTTDRGGCERLTNFFLNKKNVQDIVFYLYKQLPRVTSRRPHAWAFACVYITIITISHYLVYKRFVNKYARRANSEKYKR